MSSSPKKSRAFIITFIVVMVLLLAVYFIFKNSNSIFGTKNSSNITKTFSPLLGSSQQKSVTAINGGSGPSTNPDGSVASGGAGSTEGTTGSNTSGTGLASNQGLGSTAGVSSQNGTKAGSFGSTAGLGLGNSLSSDSSFGATTLPVTPLPTPSSDHSGAAASSTTGAGGSSGASTPPNPIGSNYNPPPVNPNACPDDPLIFTADEKAQLDDLLKQYYLIAPSLKTADDLTLVDSDLTANQALIDKANTLATECETEKADPKYTGPQAVKDNPYYQGGSNTPYIPAFSQYEQLFNIY